MPAMSGLAHQALDPFPRAAHVEAEFELGVDPGRAIGAPAHGPDVDDGVAQVGVVEVLRAHRVGPPGIEARGRHPHDPTAGRHGQVRAGPGDEGVRSFWARQRLLGEVRGRPAEDLDLHLGGAQLPTQAHQLGPLVGVRGRSLRPPSMSSCFIHRRRHDGAMPRSAAIRATGLSPVRASSIARWRNSSG